MSLTRPIVVALLIFAISPAQALALCLLPRPPIHKRRGLSSVSIYIDPYFNNDGANYGNAAFATGPCLVQGVTLSTWNVPVAGGGAGLTVTTTSAGYNEATIRIIPSAEEVFFNGHTWTWPPSADLPPYDPVTAAQIEVPLNTSQTGGFNCTRVLKLIRHEIGHVLGLTHPEDYPNISWYFPRIVPSVMHKGDPYYPPLGKIDDLPVLPTCGDVAAANEAWNYYGPPPLNAGDLGGITDCPSGWTDMSGCCMPPPIVAYVPSIGRYNRKPSVDIHAPANDATFGPGATINFTPHVWDADGSVYRVNWAYRLVGGAWNYPPASFTWPFSLTSINPPPGDYEVRADAYDTAQQYTISQSKFIHVLPPAAASETLLPNEILWPNQSRVSSNGLYVVFYQATDGNLVLYGPSGAVMGSGTFTTSPGGVYMNPNGELAIYNSGGGIMWQSGTAGNPGAYMRVKNDGHVAIFSSNGVQLVQWP